MSELELSCLESNQRKRFVKHIGGVLEIINTQKAQTAFVGGIALRAIIGKPVEYMRPNGSTPDIDIIGLGPDLNTLRRAKKAIGEYREINPDCPEVGLDVVNFSDKPVSKHAPFELMSGMRKNGVGQFFLTFRDIEVPVPPETMNIVEQDYGGLAIPTLPMETIFWRYWIRCGVIKPKDIPKLQELQFYIESSGGDVNHKQYEPYTLFFEQINHKYPSLMRINSFFLELDRMTGYQLFASGNHHYSLLYQLIGMIKR